MVLTYVAFVWPSGCSLRALLRQLLLEMLFVEGSGRLRGMFFLALLLALRFFTSVPDASQFWRQTKPPTDKQHKRLGPDLSSGLASDSGPPLCKPDSEILSRSRKSLGLACFEEVAFLDLDAGCLLLRCRCALLLLVHCNPCDETRPNAINKQRLGPKLSQGRCGNLFRSAFAFAGRS